MQTIQLDEVLQSSDSDNVDVTVAAQAEWLAWMHDIFPDASSLFLFHVNPNQTINASIASPASDVSDEVINNAVLSSVHRQKPLYLEREAQANVLVIPLVTGNRSTRYVLVLACAEYSDVQQSTAVQLSTWASTRLLNVSAEPAVTDEQLLSEFKLTNAMVQSLDRHASLDALSFTLVNKLASLCGCIRVSLGHYDDNKLKLLAMSGQSKIDDRRKIARQLCALMTETLTCQRGMYPSDDEDVKPAYQSYFKSQGEHPLLSFVMAGSHTDKFVLVLERESGKTFSDAQADAVERSVHNLASLLSIASEQQLPLRRKIKRSLSSRLSSVTALKSWSAKQMVAAAAGIALLLSVFIPVTHRVSADAYIEASDRQVLVSAQNGYILSSHARAGDYVNEGDLLATLDSKELRLAADKWQSEKAKNEQEYAQALSTHDRSELSRLRADVQRIDAEIALLEEQISRSEIRAPFAGVLLKGDWTQSLGAPVTSGDLLFEIASAQQYQLVLEVDEHDIAYIQAAQTAQLRMAALPTSVWQAELGDVMPVAVSEKGHSAFRVPATITGDAAALRPGMEGIGKVDVGQKSLFWVYSHSLFDRVRYFAWKVGLL